MHKKKVLESPCVFFKGSFVFVCLVAFIFLLTSCFVSKKALYLDGIHDCAISLSTDSVDLDIAGDGLTVEFWFKADGSWLLLDGFRSYTSIVNRYNSGQGGYGFFFVGSGDKARIAYYLGGPDNPYIQSDSELAQNVWYHIAGVLDKGTMKLYVNGVKQSQERPNQAVISSNQHLYVGLYGNDFYRGYISELRVWKLGLSQDQILSMMNKRISRRDMPPGLLWSDLMGYYHFDMNDKNLGGTALNTIFIYGATFTSSHDLPININDTTDEPNHRMPGESQISYPDRSRTPQRKEKTQFIRKIYFIVHPYIYSHFETRLSGNDTKKWQAFLERELALHERHMDLITSMKPDEALVIFPIGESTPMSRLITHATNTLGSRCIIMNSDDKRSAIRENLPDPVKTLLLDRELAKRKEYGREFLTMMGYDENTRELASNIEGEINGICLQKGCDWGLGVFFPIYYNRMHAFELQKAFKERSLLYDADSLEGIAFGEGFEQCAFTWKAMIPHYLGLARPVENDYELSVSGFPLLLNAIFRERIALSKDIRVFLWELRDGRIIGFISRAQTRLADPQYVAYVQIDGIEIEAYDVYNTRLFPAPDDRPPNLSVHAGRLAVPIFDSVRKKRDVAYYLVARNVSYEKFRGVLIEADLREYTSER